MASNGIPCDAPPAIDRKPCLAVVAVTVGKQPPAVTLMGRAGISRTKDSVAPGISSRHKVSDDDVPTLEPDARAVFEEYPLRSNNVDCSHGLPVEAGSISVDALPAWVGGADIGAREASAQRIDASHASKVHPSDISLDDMYPGEAGA